MVEIVNYSPEYEKVHYEFASVMFGTRRKRRNPDYIYWKFRGRKGTEMPSFKLAILNGEVVGQLGLIPCKLLVDNEIIEAQWACDLMVHKNCRGKGIAAKLYENAHVQKILTLGSDPSPAAEISMLRNGYKKTLSAHRYFIPYHIGTPLKMKGININALNKVKNPFLNFFSVKEVSSLFQMLEISPERLNDIFKDRFKSNRLSVYIDQAFYQWRYFSFKDYYPGIKVFQLKGHETYFSGYYMGGTFFITDLQLSDKRHITKIISFILEKGKGMPLNRINFLNNEKEMRFHELKPVAIKYKTDTIIIYYTENLELAQKISQRYFYYTLRDSDENI
ncbi:GNAT family N-acetyltransferase [Marinilabilia salmonicolor]|uniref:GNAT family N-acetyltransferase n=1 Tax=Marinilabilia salmonicolor TaxID=989 RepID=UPI00029A42E7|nr:GNAT family N-acetyltransferase [Marinilabilia salmonicolor]